GPLRDGLNAGLVPPKRAGKNLIIGTWNLREFGALTQRWSPSKTDSPKRCLADILAIAEIVRRFDVAALQETTRNLTALRTLKAALGPQWAFIVSDVTEGKAGNDERLAVIFDLGRVAPSGLVGEVVIPQEQLGIAAGGLLRQFARTPYAVSFRAGSATFTLVTVHILWGVGPAERTPEVAAFAAWLAQQTDQADIFNPNLIPLGGFK